MTLDPSYAIVEDHVLGVIRMRVVGFFDLATLHRHFDDNGAVVSEWRDAGRAIRVFIDAAGLMPHTPEGQACVQAETARIYRPGDQVAVRVASALIRMQMRRALREGDVLEFFTSESEALAWLAG